MTCRTQAVIGVVLLLAAGICAWWCYVSRETRTLDGTAAMILISDKSKSCRVSEHGQVAGQELPCAEAVSYLDQLRLGAGASIAITAVGEVSPAAINGIRAQLVESGYRPAGVARVGFLTGPKVKDGM